MQPWAARHTPPSPGSLVSPRLPPWVSITCSQPQRGMGGWAGDGGHRLSHCPTSTPQPCDSTSPELDRCKIRAREPGGPLGQKGDTHSPHPHTKPHPSCALGLASRTLPPCPQDPPPPSSTACPGGASHLHRQHPRVLSWPWRAGAPRNPGLGVYRTHQPLIMAQVKTMPSVEAGNNPWAGAGCSAQQGPPLAPHPPIRWGTPPPQG